MGVQQPAVADKSLENCALWLCVSNYGNPQLPSQPASQQQLFGEERSLMSFKTSVRSMATWSWRFALNALIGLISPQMLPRDSHKRFMIVVVDLLAFESDNYPISLDSELFPFPRLSLHPIPLIITKYLLLIQILSVCLCVAVLIQTNQNEAPQILIHMNVFTCCLSVKIISRHKHFWALMFLIQTNLFSCCLM